MFAGNNSFELFNRHVIINGVDFHPRFSTPASFLSGGSRPSSRTPRTDSWFAGVDTHMCAKFFNGSRLLGVVCHLTHSTWYILPIYNLTTQSFQRYVCSFHNLKWATWPDHALLEVVCYPRPSHLIFYSLKTVFKRNCVQNLYTYAYNKIQWLQIIHNDNDTYKFGL